MSDELISAGRSVIELRKPAKSIAQVEAEARARGLTYGKYLAGCRADRELAEQARKREEERRELERVERQARRRHKGGGGENKKRVVMMDADCKTLRVFDSQVAAARETRFQQGNISAECVRYETLKRTGGKLRPCKKGVRWRFATEED